MSETCYAARTNYAFGLNETVAVAQLIYQGEITKDIIRKVIEEDLFQLRAVTSRKRALSVILKRLHKVNEAYIQLLATGNSDIRRLTVLFLILRQDRLLQELISEVLLDKLKRFIYIVQPVDLQIFFETKRSQNSTIAAWSESTYHKVTSSCILTLVRAGLLQPIKPRGNYEIRPVPLPVSLRQQLLADGQEIYLTLMLN
jgi:hypothetical protein